MAKTFTTETASLKDIVEDNANNKLVLPTFQRQYVWDKNQQQSLISAFIVEIPIGGLLILEGKKDDFSSRPLCFNEGGAEPNDDCSYLLDGQQRISTLKCAYYDIFDDSSQTWEELYEKLPHQLQNRWFLRVEPQREGNEDKFGYNNLKLKTLSNYEPDEIKDFIIHKKINLRSIGGKAVEECWYHPLFKPKHSDGNLMTDAEKRNKIVESACDEKLIPLWEIGKDKDLHVQVIRRLASKKLELLKLKLKGKEIKLSDIFEKKTREEKKQQKELQKNYNRKNQEAINLVNEEFADLKSDWQNNIKVQLNDLVKNEKIPRTKLKAQEIHRAVAIFDSINQGGTPLSVFDLVAAKVAKEIPKGEKGLGLLITDIIVEKIKLQSNVTGLRENLDWSALSYDVIKDKLPTKDVTNWFNNILSMIVYCKVGIDGEKDEIGIEHIKKTKILELKPKQIADNYKRATIAIRRALCFMQIRTGIVYADDLKYRLMLIPIAYVLDEDKHWKNKKAWNKIEYWYWLSAFAGNFQNSQNEQCIEDTKKLHEWVETNNQNPFEKRLGRLLNQEGYSSKETLLHQKDDELPGTAIQSFLQQYVLSKTPKDLLIEGEDLKAWEIANNNHKLHSHHIITLGSQRKIGQLASDIRRNKEHVLNSPLNKTLISPHANSQISDLPVQQYFRQLSDFARSDHYIDQSVLDLDFQDESVDVSEALGTRFNAIKDEINRELSGLV